MNLYEQFQMLLHYNSTLATIWKLYERGEYQLDEALLYMIIKLVEQNSELTKQLEHTISMMPRSRL